MSRKDALKLSPRILNRKAHHEYAIHSKIEVGIMLVGSEVKSIRQGSVSLSEGYARVEKDGNLYLYDVDISPYSQARGASGHAPKRIRQLLAHKREIARLAGETSTKGTTLIPLAMYFLRGHVKIEIGVATGKREFDRREDIKTREADREVRRALSKKM